MNLVIHSQYYPPETGAPQNRLHESAKLLRNLGVTVSVLTAMPNHPTGHVFEQYSGKFFHHEVIDGIHVYRSWIYPSNSSKIIPRLCNYFSFVITSFFVGLACLKRPDIILTESPPLFLGITGYLLCKFKRAKLIFNVSDLWPESVVKLGLMPETSFFIKVAYRFELFLYKKSALILGQTRGIVSHIQTLVSPHKVMVFTNGIDPELFPPNLPSHDFLKTHHLENKFICCYAGVLGLAQGLQVILEAAKLLQQGYPDIMFIFIGNGAEQEKLHALRDEYRLDNVMFLGSFSKTAMPEAIASIDVSLVPLRKLALFEGAIPSKIFENMSAEKPIVLGVDGEARVILEAAQGGIFVEPENVIALRDAVLYLYHHPEERKQMGRNARQYVLEKFDRKKLVATLYDRLQELLT